MPTVLTRTGRAAHGWAATGAILALALSLAACSNDRRPVQAAQDVVGSALSRLELPDEGGQPAAVVALRKRGADGAGNGVLDAARRQDARIGLRWAWKPKELQVYRSTAVHFRLEAAPAGHETAACEWNFGDGTPMVHGCNVSHTFHGSVRRQPHGGRYYGSGQWPSTDLVHTGDGRKTTAPEPGLVFE